jgi:uncharacterized protein (DUF2147 family)
MKRILSSLLAVAVAATPVAASAQSPLEGHWKRKALEIEIAPCGETLCGTVVKASEEDRAKALQATGRELIGSRVLTNIRPAGPGAWHGTAFIADYNTSARTTLRLTSSGTLDVKGCILLVLCRTKTWERAR